MLTPNPPPVATPLRRQRYGGRTLFFGAAAAAAVAVCIAVLNLAADGSAPALTVLWGRLGTCVGGGGTRKTAVVPAAEVLLLEAMEGSDGDGDEGERPG